MRKSYGKDIVEAGLTIGAGVVVGDAVADAVGDSIAGTVAGAVAGTAATALTGGLIKAINDETGIISDVGGVVDDFFSIF